MKTDVFQDLDPAKWNEHLYGLTPERWASLKGKSFWVTGAGTGYGRCVSCALAASGAKVFLTGRRTEKLQESVEEISSMDITTENCHIIETDITNYDSILNACSKIKELCSTLDGLVNNAAIPTRPGGHKPFQNDPLEYWNNMMATNVTAPWLLTKTIFPFMIFSGGVRVLFIGSEAGWANNTSGNGMYKVSKAALNGLNRAIALEYAHCFPDHDIQMNLLVPGQARTEMNRGSKRSPYTIASMALILLSHPEEGPNGRYFHQDGRHLQFGNTEQFDTPLIKLTKPEIMNMHEHKTSGLGKQSSDKRFLPKLKTVVKWINERVDRDATPQRAWVKKADSIYPIDIPDIKFLPGQDLILLAPPARIQAMMPNGIGYVHNILKQTDIQFQTMDLDIILYHRYHSQRITDGLEKIITKSGYTMKDDPWDPTGIEEVWNKPEVIEYFQPEINKIVKGLVEACPKIIGLSVHNTNHSFSREIVKGVRAQMPDAIILVGGYSCVHYTAGPLKFPHFDYMVVGEAELTLEPLLNALVTGEKPKDMPGIISHDDSPDRKWVPGEMLHDLDSIDFPRYDWTDISLYRRYDGKHLTPIITSRGCNWARCRFCSEKFSWRVRSPRNFVDELEWLVGHGCKVFQINDSDLNGDPEVLLKMCNEIISRKLKVILTGQLRITKHSTREYFDRLRDAGFTRLRFGVDAWSNHTSKLQLKGYNMKLVKQNLRNCHEAGIYISVNAIVGIPGETEDDVKEIIENILDNKDYIGMVESVRSLILQDGSDYHQNPEQFKISFRGDKNEIYSKYPITVPDHLWYSTDPYIDHKVKQERWLSVVEALVAGDITVGNYVKARAEGKTADSGSCRIIQKSIAPRLVSDQKLIEEGHNGFNIISCGGKIYGLAQSEGCLNLDKVNTKDYRCVVGDSVDEVKGLIDRLLVTVSDHKLIQEGYRGFNIISCEDKFYGLAQSEGVFEVEKVEKGEFDQCFVGISVNEVKGLIDQLLSKEEGLNRWQKGLQKILQLALGKKQTARKLSTYVSKQIKQDINNEQKTLGVYYPSPAYRSNLGSEKMYNKIRQQGYNVVFLFGTICNDEYEKRPYSYYVGGGIIKYLDLIDIFVFPTLTDDLPERSKKVLFVHDIYNSPRGKAETPIKPDDGKPMFAPPLLDELDYTFLPGTSVMPKSNRVPYIRKKPLCRIPGGYFKLDRNIRYFESKKCPIDSIIYAPTVCNDNFVNYVSLPEYGGKIIYALLENFPDYNIIFRPHPHTLDTKYVSEIVQQFSGNKRFAFDSNPSFYLDNYCRSRLMISDMSGTAFTFAFTTFRPVVFFSHNEAKVEDAFGHVHYFKDRNKIGCVATNIDELNEKVTMLLNRNDEFKEDIRKFRNSEIYNVGKAEDYFAENFHYITEGKKHKDWQYVVSARPLETWKSVETPI